MHQIKLQFRSSLDFDDAVRLMGKIVTDTATIEDYRAFQKICAMRPPVLHAKRDARSGSTPESERREQAFQASRKISHLKPIVGSDGTVYVVRLAEGGYELYQKHPKAEGFSLVPGSLRLASSTVYRLAREKANT